MAFVVVTHQQAQHPSLLPELLRRCTTMPVTEASEGLVLKPNGVYIARPEGYLAISRGQLRLLPIPEDSGLRLPIDFFFRSLAQDQQERAIGIILSGTATDGTLGIKAIKESAGLAMAQDPDSAQYPGMPRSAIGTGLVDLVLPARLLPERLLAYARGTVSSPPPSEWETERTATEPLSEILLLLKSRTGHDFSGYKSNTIRRRLDRRMSLHQVRNPKEYLAILQAHPHELDLLFKELLISVTSFFRDPSAFAVLAKGPLLDLLESRAEDSTVRVWVPGCATGEEAYSLAILLRECSEKLNKRFSFQVFATDLDSAAIEQGRSGVYPEGVAADISPERLKRFFTPEEGHYRLRKTIRDLITFAPQNVCKDPPFTRLDLISCRNLLIYLETSLQQRLLSLFHYSLRPDGLLFLGPSESVGERRDHFSVVDKKAKIYRRTGSPLPVSTATGSTRGIPGSITPSTSVGSSREPTIEPRLAAKFEQALLSRFAPASVIVNDRGDISYFHGRAGRYLEPAQGRPNLNVVEMAREGLRPALASLLRRAATERNDVALTLPGVKWNNTRSEVDVAVSRILEPEALRGLFLITFQPSASSGDRLKRGRKPTESQASKGRVAELEQELLFARESLQRTVEELQSTNEELKSSYEELQSTNEELQSTNEELETSKEEMQSLNEELLTTNAQLQSKVEAYLQANDDMQNLLNSTAISTVFLDCQLNIRRFTEEARKVFHLIPSDVGRPIADLVSNLNYGQLVADATEVLRTLATHESEVSTREGGWCQVRILPYRTTENVIDGLVITFMDITRTKLAERAAEQSRTYAESIVTAVREPLLVLNHELRVFSANHAFYRKFKLTAEETLRRPFLELGNGQWNIPALRSRLEKVLPQQSNFENLLVRLEIAGLGRRALNCSAHRLEQPTEKKGLFLLTMEDVTEARGVSLGKTRGKRAPQSRPRKPGRVTRK